MDKYSFFSIVVLPTRSRKCPNQLCPIGLYGTSVFGCVWYQILFWNFDYFGPIVYYLYVNWYNLRCYNICLGEATSVFWQQLVLFCLISVTAYIHSTLFCSRWSLLAFEAQWQSPSTEKQGKIRWRFGGQTTSRTAFPYGRA